jgi:aryl-alcohol dehydrogenase-like predicted oxidoreductase
MNDSKIAQVRLGSEGPLVGVQGLGCMGMSEFYGDTDEAAARETLEVALAEGVTLFDTADVYGRGANEEFLAPFVAAHRDEITLATKFAIVRTDDPHYRAVRNDPAYIRQSVEGSLRRLGVDVIDL